MAGLLCFAVLELLEQSALLLTPRSSLLFLQHGSLPALTVRLSACLQWGWSGHITTNTHFGVV